MYIPYIGWYMIIEWDMDHHSDLMLGVWINSLTVYDEESVHKSVHKSESVCDENDMMYDESFDEKMWMKRVMWFRDERGEIVAMRDVMTSDEKCMMRSVMRREAR